MNTDEVRAIYEGAMEGPWSVRPDGWQVVSETVNIAAGWHFTIPRSSPCTTAWANKPWPAWLREIRATLATTTEEGGE